MCQNIEMGKRIKCRREELGLTLKNVADKIGVAASTIQRYETGTIRHSKLPVITAIADALNVNTEWLTLESDVKYKYSKDNSLHSKNKVYAVKIPLLKSVCNIQDMFCDDNISDYIAVDYKYVKKGDYFWLEATDNSMSQTGINKGDLLLFRRQSIVKSGDIAIIAINKNHSAIIRKVIKKNSILILQSENISEEPLLYTENEFKLISVIGKLLKCVKNF